MATKSYGSLILLPLFAIASGCSSTDGELLSALNVDEESALCVAPQMLGVDLFQAASDGRMYFAEAGAVSFGGRQSNVDGLSALIDEDYASDEKTILPNGFASTVDAWEVTEKFAPYYGEFENICIGTLHATDIIEYTEPGEGGQQVIQARFNYEISYNDLIDDLGVEDELDEAVSRKWTGEGMATYVKTNKGWRMEMAFWAGI